MVPKHLVFTQFSKVKTRCLEINDSWRKTNHRLQYKFFILPPYILLILLYILELECVMTGLVYTTVLL